MLPSLRAPKESGKNSGVLCGSEQRRGWLKDRVEGQAGYAAEGEANSTDEKLARTYAGTICKPSAVKAFLEFARQQAREILQAHWRAVLDLAKALDRRGTLSGQERDRRDHRHGRL